MGSTEVSTHTESPIRKSPSFPCKSNLKESLLSPETISPNSQILGQQWEWWQESQSRHPEEEIHLLGFPTSYCSRQDFSLSFFHISTFPHYYFTYSIHTQIWDYFVSDTDSDLSIKSLHAPYFFIFHQEDYTLIWNGRNSFCFQFLIALYVAEKQYIMRSESSKLAWCPAGSR